MGVLVPRRHIYEVGSAKKSDFKGPFCRDSSIFLPPIERPMTHLMLRVVGTVNSAKKLNIQAVISVLRSYETVSAKQQSIPIRQEYHIACKMLESMYIYPDAGGAEMAFNDAIG